MSAGTELGDACGSNRTFMELKSQGVGSIAAPSAF